MELAEDRISVHADRRKMPEGLARGVPNYWYPILRSDQLAAAPLQIERFSENLVVWRGREGQPHVFENHCPHRRAPLSRGKVMGDELACAYHGWRFDRAGACVAMPLEAPSTAALARHSVKAYPAVDHGGYIWMFYGEASRVTPFALPAELSDPAWMAFKTEYYWDTNWLNILDNVMDPLHAIYLHTGAVTQRKRAKFKEFRITSEDEKGFRLGKIGIYEDGSTGPVEGEVEFALPNLVRLDIADGTQSGLYRVVIMPTPVNEGSTCAFYVRTRHTQGPWSRFKWRLWWTLHGRSVHEVAGQDRDILAGLGPIHEARSQEHLALSDTGVVRLRRRLQQAFHANER